MTHSSDPGDSQGVSRALERLDAVFAAMEAALDDPGRLQSVEAALNLEMPGLEALVEQVRQEVGVPFVGATVLDKTEQHFIASTVPVESCSRDHSYCQYVVASGRTLSITDVLSHPATRRMPPYLVDRMRPKQSTIRAYLGVPLVAPEGHILGALCAVDTDKPRFWTTSQKDALVVGSARITALWAAQREREREG